MTSQDILFVVLAVCAIFISVPLMMVLWRVYTMMARVDKVLDYVNHLRELALEFEKVPMKLIESVIGSLTNKETPRKK